MKKMILTAIAILAATQGLAAHSDLEARYQAAKANIDKQAEENLANGLENLERRAAASGQPREVLEIREEKARFGGDLFKALKSDNKQIAELAQAVSGRHAEQMVTLLRAYVPRLEVLVKQLTIGNRIEDALKVEKRLEGVRFELADYETRLPKKEVEQGRKLVIWNKGDRKTNKHRTEEANVILFKGNIIKREVWRKDGVDFPWIPNTDDKVEIEIPADIQFDRVRVEVTKWNGYGGGLAEIQVFDGEENIALGCHVDGSGYWRGRSGRALPSRVTNGITTYKWGGFWRLPNNTAGWIEVDLTKKAN